LTDEDKGRTRPPNDLRPMMATLAAKPPTDEGWAWELKWDGVRALGYVQSGDIRLVSRNGIEVTHRYPELRPLAEAIGGRQAVLDGEIVAFDERGRPSFQRLQRRMHVEDASRVRSLAHEVPAVYVLFDVLWLDGASTMELPYERRRELLLDLALEGSSWRTPPHELGDGSATIETSRAFELEGVIAKRLGSRYEQGRRSRAWLKIKQQLRQEFVVGGWQSGEGARAGTIGSLLIGYYDGGVLHYAGRVGSGLSQDTITELEALLAEHASDHNPFAAGRPPKDAHWADPVIVIEVRFSEWTAGDAVRHPTFLGIRYDKDPTEVVREVPT
jgi:bifunctional non-homologous end joining protein LigD